jgi:hypothetical protein
MFVQQANKSKSASQPRCQRGTFLGTHAGANRAAGHTKLVVVTFGFSTVATLQVGSLTLRRRPHQILLQSSIMTTIGSDAN